MRKQPTHRWAELLRCFMTSGRSEVKIRAKGTERTETRDRQMEGGRGRAQLETLRKDQGKEGASRGGGIPEVGFRLVQGHEQPPFPPPHTKKDQETDMQKTGKPGLVASCWCLRQGPPGSPHTQSPFVLENNISPDF